jgi:hypothetical protein
MTEPNTSMPPIDMEQWIDFIIASAAHRSQNTCQQKFGDGLIQRYFVTLPDRYQDDPVATRYFDEMLCTVSSAIRGFSVVRDVFQTNWETMKSAKDSALKCAERVEVFSPVKKDGVWGIVVAAVIGLGLGVPLSAVVKERFATHGFPLLLVSIAAIGGSIVLMTVVAELLRAWLISRAEGQFPSKLMDSWQDRSLKGYRMVIKQFVPLAMEIANRHYPGTYSDSLTDVELDRIVERHFAFKLKEPTVSPEADQPQTAIANEDLPSVAAVTDSLILSSTPNEQQESISQNVGSR